jgi:four helix bundle protein
MGSASETEYQFLLARDLGYINDTVFDELTGSVTEVKRMLAAFITKLKADR